VAETNQLVNVGKPEAQPAGGRLPGLRRMTRTESGVLERMCLELAEGIRGARPVRIPQTDHVIPLRRPQEFIGVVLSYLGEIL
jgi:hypothetical protein